MSKRKYFEKLNIAVAAALVLGNSASVSLAQNAAQFRNTIESDGLCNEADRGDPDCTPLFPTGSEG